MSDPIENLRALQVIHTQQHRLAARKHELERQARQSSAQTRSRACRLVCDATLALLSRRVSVNKKTLTREIETCAHDGDRFAAALARDWLEAATQASCAPGEHGEEMGSGPES